MLGQDARIGPLVRCRAEWRRFALVGIIDPLFAVKCSEIHGSRSEDKAKQRRIIAERRVRVYGVRPFALRSNS
jgi:hypothetical protein